MSSKSNKNKKRNRSEEKEWQWDDTVLKDSNDTPLKLDSIRQLLRTRGEKNQNIPGKKVDMIEYLKKKHAVALDLDYSTLTVKELMAELKLRGLNDNTAKKSILVQRINGEIDVLFCFMRIFGINKNNKTENASPPKKKVKRAKKTKLMPKVYVAVYTPAATEENDALIVLGVFKTESKAYEMAMHRLIKDVETYYDKDEEKINKAMKKFDDMLDSEYKQRMEELTEIVANAFNGKEGEEPYCDVHKAPIYD